MLTNVFVRMGLRTEATVRPSIWTALTVASTVAITSAPIWRPAMSKGLLILMALLVTGSFFLAGISAVFKQFDNHDAKSMRDWIITYMHAAVLFACVYFVFSSAVYGFESFRGVESLAWMKGEHSIGSYVEAFVSFFYFSVVSITTLGYGDIHPALSWAKLLVSLEALLGLYIIAVGIGRALAVRSSEFKDQPQQVHDAWKHSSGVR